MVKKGLHTARSAQSIRDIHEDDKLHKRIRRREKINSFIMSPFYFALLVAFTLYSLYSDDFRLACSNASGDPVWNAFTIVTIVFFFFDIIVNGYYKPHFWRTAGFFFMILAFLSLILDLTWLWNAQTVNNWVTGNNLIPVIIQAVSNSANMQRFYWCMRFIRYLRFMFLINFFQGIIDKLDYKEDQLTLLKERAGYIQIPNNNKLDGRDQLMMKKKFLTYPTFDFDKDLQTEVEGHAKQVSVEEPEIHNTSRSFTYISIRRAMFLNIFVMVNIQLFLSMTFTTYLSASQSTANQVQYLITNNFYNRSNNFLILQNYINIQTKSKNPPASITVYNLTQPVLGLNSTGLIYWAFNPAEISNYNSYSISGNPIDGSVEVNYTRSRRLSECLIFTSPSDISTVPINGTFTLSIFDYRDSIVTDAAIGIGRTTIIIFLFIYTIYLFYNDSKKLLLGPFAEMMTKIKKIEENPMTAAKEMQAEIAEKEKSAKFNSKLRAELNELKKYETNILTNTLAKSGQLLALGFGEAGINIILEKLKKGSEMVGKKVICLFGFADIKMFTEVSDKLKEEVMIFVNEIAEILSPIVEKCTGATNKNLGEAFLFVWKFREEDTITMFDYDADGHLHKNVKLKEFSDKNNSITDRCDLALLSFLECIIHVHQSPTLSKYKHDKRLKDLPNFKVKNSFGLHIGWGIEGAIGSEHKIDASYLSPNVNLASRVQYATKQFGVHVLISGMVYDLLSKEIQILMREVDCVELKGSKLAMHLWTYDMDLSNLELRHDPKLTEEKLKNYEVLKKERMIEYRKDLKYFHKQFYDGKISGMAMFLSKKSVIDVHRKFTKEFYDAWKSGYSLYIDGKWPEARPFFEKTVDLLPDYHDKPSEVILGFLKAANYEKPVYWNGVRHLTSK